MAEPLTWQLLQFLQARLQQITVSNGYLTDIGSGPVVIDEDDVPGTSTAAIVVAINGFAPTASTTSTVLTETANVTVEFSVPRSVITGAGLLAQRARVDLLRALSFKERLMPAGCYGWTITGADLVDAEESAGRSFAVAQVTARVGLKQAFDPAPTPTPPSP